MATTSPVLAIPVPEPGDADDISAIVGAVATRLDAAVVAKAGGSTITASGPTVRGLVVKGAASQTANLQEWQNSAGAILTRIASDGAVVTDADLTVGGDIHQPDVGNVAYFGSITYQGARVHAVGDSTSGTGLYAQPGLAAGKGLVVRGFPGQSGNLAEFQNSSGTVLANVAADGQWGHVFGSGIGYRTVQAGAADSAGTGFRTMRIAN